ncbi:MAG: alpha-amylase [Bacteroidales bacterium]|jgi:glycosidase|nr:alpha-amylase [Bacteroidales bacterium]
MKKLSSWMLALTFVLALSSCSNKQSGNASVSTFDSLPYPDWVKNAVIYEVNVRQYTHEGTFKAFNRSLPRLKELGADILWFMPIYPIGEKDRKGSLGSYYAIRDYKDVNPEFGTKADFLETVKKAHELGFKVIIDWVANHTATDNVWVTQHPDWYVTDSLGNIVSPFDWTDTYQLNYANPDLINAMIDAMKYWITEFDVDGFRCDVAGLVPVTFWEKARKELDAVKPVFMLAEDEEKNELTENAFDANYGWELHHTFAAIYKGEKNASDIVALLQKQDSIFPKNSVKMNFLTNHDENSWNGTVDEKFGTSDKVFAALIYTLPGVPLIYSGQEANCKKRIAFFERDPISWNDTSLFHFYKDLNFLKHANEALFNPPYGGEFAVVANDCPEHILSFVRKGASDIIVIANLSASPVSFTVIDDTALGMYQNLSSSQVSDKITLGKDTPLTLEPWGYRIWTKAQ